MDQVHLWPGRAKGPQCLTRMRRPWVSNLAPSSPTFLSFSMHHRSFLEPPLGHTGLERNGAFNAPASEATFGSASGYHVGLPLEGQPWPPACLTQTNPGRRTRNIYWWAGAVDYGGNCSCLGDQRATSLLVWAAQRLLPFWPKALILSSSKPSLPVSSSRHCTHPRGCAYSNARQTPLSHCVPVAFLHLPRATTCGTARTTPHSHTRERGWLLWRMSKDNWNRQPASSAAAWVKVANSSPPLLD